MAQLEVSELIEMLPRDLVHELLDFAVGQQFRAAFCNYSHGNGTKSVVVDYYGPSDQAPEQVPRPWLMEREIEAGVANVAVARFWRIVVDRYVHEKFGGLSAGDRSLLIKLIVEFITSEYESVMARVISRANPVTERVWQAVFDGLLASEGIAQ